MIKKILIKQVKSGIGHRKKSKETLKALGLRKMNRTVEKNNTPAIRGMIDKVSHLLEVIEK
tara:strand:+ start:247 stop:429 length:183 start_codon:yes stop_codon:yes gene_type:complete